jgi:hypothetical protein
MPSGYDLTLSGLLRKRAEMAGELEGLRVQTRSLLDALQHIDAAILVFKPDLQIEDLPEAPPPLPFAGFRGEIQRFLLDELRKANHPLSTFDLAERIMRKRGLDPEDRVVFKLMARRTGYGLAKLRKRGKVTSHRAHSSAVMEWELCARNDTRCGWGKP